MVGEDCRYEKNQRHQNEGYAYGVTEAVDRMLVAGGVLRDPVIPGAVAEHSCLRGEHRLLLQRRQVEVKWSGGEKVACVVAIKNVSSAVRILLSRRDRLILK